MLYLTDHPLNTQSLLPAGCAWRRCAEGDLSHLETRIMRMAGASADPSAWHRCTNGAAGPGEAGLMVLIDDARHSQFAALMQALREGMDVPDRLVLLALSGSGFHGQHGRPWTALRGNLHLTTHHCVDLPAARAAAALTMLPAIAAAQAIEQASTGRLVPKIKWVNDVLVHGRKVAGVLTGTHVERDRIRRVVFGIGVNVQRCPEVNPARGAPPAAALADFDCALGALLPQMACLLRERLDDMLRLAESDAADLFGAYRSRSAFIGREVRIWPEHGEAEAGVPLMAGRVTDLHPDLSLRIHGAPEPVRRGRMELLDPLGVVSGTAAEEGEVGAQ